MVAAGAPNLLVGLLSQPQPSAGGAREQAVWALSNIAGAGVECRDAVISTTGLMPNLARHLSVSVARLSPPPAVQCRYWIALPRRRSLVTGGLLPRAFSAGADRVQRAVR